MFVAMFAGVVAYALWPSQHGAQFDAGCAALPL